MSDVPNKFDIVDDASVRELYANKLVATSFDGSVLSVTLGTARLMPQRDGEPPAKDKPASIHVTARLALSPAGAVELANALGAMLKTLSQRQQKGSQAEEPEQAKTK